ncbi:hypothetical protein RDV64_09365 [Acuticoccus sp. MNP-M23]|uniref:hypothetical protein n=1 Tax=Acuticoccus sp. MNP-M23 TaxID=3072793 RepID=UPI002815A68B|nr:hypothetical protein [Acuticoccus sp. MNP-M23]WMS44563.1 hypothetical protein RDV64_09365 [Acuticoccus sp. MNP-M23]
MNIKKTIVAASTAIALSAAAVAAPTAASATPFAALKSAQIETGATAVDTVGSRNRRHRRPHRGHRGRHFNNGAAAAIGFGAFALGAALAANAAPQRVYCRDVRTERWSPRRGAYVIRIKRVCN